MSTSSESVERLFPFVLRARLLVSGREPLQRMRRKLAFILIAEGLRPESRAAIVEDYAGLPVVERYTSADLDRFFHLRGAKVLGFRKSTLASSLLRELKPYRLAAARLTEEKPPAEASAPTAPHPRPVAVDKPARDSSTKPASRPPRPYARPPQAKSDFRPRGPARFGRDRDDFGRDRRAPRRPFDNPQRPAFKSRSDRFSRPDRRVDRGYGEPARPWRPFAPATHPDEPLERGDAKEKSFGRRRATEARPFADQRAPRPGGRPFAGARPGNRPERPARPWSKPSLGARQARPPRPPRPHGGKSYRHAYSASP